MTKKLKIIGDFNFEERRIVSSFVEGKGAEYIYKEVLKTIKTGVWYDPRTERMDGGSTLLAARVDSIVRPLGIRVTNLADLIRPEIRRMTEGEYHFVTPDIIFRSMKDNFEPNRILIEKLVPLVEEKLGVLKLPCLISGFDVKPSKDKRGYGVEIVPRSDFSVLYDGRLVGRNYTEVFSCVDRNKLPMLSHSKFGIVSWQSAKDGLSSLSLGRSGNIHSYGSGLMTSSENGRIVLVKDVVEKR